MTINYLISADSQHCRPVCVQATIYSTIIPIAVAINIGRLPLSSGIQLLENNVVQLAALHLVIGS